MQCDCDHLSLFFRSHCIEAMSFLTLELEQVVLEHILPNRNYLYGTKLEEEEDGNRKGMGPSFSCHAYYHACEGESQGKANKYYCYQVAN